MCFSKHSMRKSVKLYFTTLHSNLINLNAAYSQTTRNSLRMKFNINHYFRPQNINKTSTITSNPSAVSNYETLKPTKTLSCLRLKAEIMDNTFCTTCIIALTLIIFHAKCIRYDVLSSSNLSKFLSSFFSTSQHHWKVTYV